MNNKIKGVCAVVLLLAGTVSAQYTNTVYSDSSDGMIEFRTDWASPTNHFENDSNGYATTGEWYGTNGLVCTVLPFQVPNLGVTNNPFTSVSLQVFLEANNLTATAIDLYYVRTSTNAAVVATNDYYSGTGDTNATLLQATFIDDGSGVGIFIDTDTAANTNLLSILNTAYDGGAGVGDFVFFRLSYSSDDWPTTSESATIHTADYWDQPYRPKLLVGSIADPDEDGLPSGWELEYDLDPDDETGEHGAAGNPDLDGLLNFDEYFFGTDPRNADSDDDGLEDDEEVLASPATDPLDADTDDDYLSDFDEVDSYGTNPTEADSDFDGVNDATEVYALSDPNSSTNQPTNARAEVIGLEGFDYTNGVFANATIGGELFDYDNNISNDTYVGHTGASSPWYITSETPTIESGRIWTQFGGGIFRELNGEATGGKDISLFASASLSPEVSSEVMYAKFDITRSPGADWSGFSCFASGQEEIFFGVADNGGSYEFKVEESGEASTFSGVVATNNQTYTLVVKIDGAANTASLWINPVLEGGEGLADVEHSIPTSNLRCDAIRLASGGSGKVYWDNLVLGTTWDALSTTSSDGDGDGLPDSWEEANDLNPGVSTGDDGALGDPDEDGVTNEDEFDNGTDPQEADTDGDGLNDLDEIALTTDPLDNDTDDDGLLDGEEVFTYNTLPKVVDSDSDGEDDGIEVLQGSLPDDGGSTASTVGVPAIDGTLDTNVYGNAVAIQTVQTDFGDNESELDAAYAYMTSNKLYLVLTGNLQDNWNKLELFIDSTDTVTTNVLDAVNNDYGSGDKLDGMTFDVDFEPDYHMEIRHDSSQFWIDVMKLGAVSSNLSSYGDIFVGSGEGIALTGTGDVNAYPIGIGFDNSNTAGIGGGTNAADQVAATNVLTGLELCIDLADIGNPSGAIKIAAMINSNNRDYLSNQILGGLPAPRGNLGGDGASGWDGNLDGINFNTFSGDQFFVLGQDGIFISAMQFISSNTEVQLMLDGLTIGQDYVIQDALDLTAGFLDVDGSQFTATNAVDSVILPIDLVTEPVRFFQASETP